MVFLFIFVSFALLELVIIFAKIQIQIVNFNFNSQTQTHLNKDYEIIFKLYILKVIPILKVKITKTKLEKLKLSQKISKIDFKYLEKNQKIDKKILKAIKKINLAIKNINLHIDIGTENASLTSIIVPVISTIIAILLRKKVKKIDNQIFIIHPIYQNQNLVNIYLSGIFELKMRYIIDIIYILTRKEKKGVKEYERTSNRRSYDYSYE